MDLSQLPERAAQLAAVLREQLTTEMQTVAQTGLAMVITRVSETGKDASGGSFKPYTAAYEQFKRFGSSASTKEGAKKRAARKVAPASAEKPVGRYRGFVDFTLSGQMLSSTGVGYKNIGPTSTTASANTVTVVVSGRDEETRGKMQGNDNYRPGWFKLSADERKELARQSQVRLTTFAQNFLG